MMRTPNARRQKPRAAMCLTFLTLMEGPSLYLAQQQLRPFARKTVLDVSGNTKIGKERLHGQRVREIFAWGKHLVFQLEGFAMRIHFMLFGSFEAEIDGKWVTGDYRR